MGAHLPIGRRLMMERYGPPRRVSNQRLSWKNNGPWLRTVVHSFGELRSFPRLARNVLEQTARYKGSLARKGLLAEFDPTLKAQGNELTVANESEEINLATLNLADEVLRGSKTPGQARRLLVRVVDLVDAGKRTPYTEGLSFNYRRPR